MLLLSVLGNVVLLMLVVYIGYFKTNYINLKLQKIGLVEFDEKLRGDYWCIQGWTNTLEKLNIDVDVVFFGNSITRGSNFDKYFKDVSICNLGYPGDDTYGMTLRVKQIKAVNPEKVFVMAGINGLAHQSKEIFTIRYVALVDSIKETVPNAHIFIQSILPVNTQMDMGKNFKGKEQRIQEYNEIVKSIAKEKECTYIDLYSLYAVDGILPKQLTKDGIHLKPEAYERWANAIRQYIE